MKTITANKAPLLGIMLFMFTISLVILMYSFKTEQQEQVQEISTINPIQLI